MRDLKRPMQEDYIAASRESLDAAIRELNSAATFMDRAGENELSADINHTVHLVRVLRSRVCLLRPQ